MTNCLYEVPVRVLNREGCGLPNEFAGAVIACYVAASDPLAAVRRAKLAVEKLNYAFDDLASDQVRELDIGDWDDYVQQAWPEASDELPRQAELPKLVERGIVFLGPAVGFFNR
jgi:hypothetical protein